MLLLRRIDIVFPGGILIYNELWMGFKVHNISVLVSWRIYLPLGTLILFLVVIRFLLRLNGQMYSI